MRTSRRLSRSVPLCVLLLGTACLEDPVDTRVNTGTIHGVPFTVVSGIVLQDREDGAILGETTGALIVLDQGPAALGMSDANRLHLRTTFALRHGGTITIGAFGTAGDALGHGSAVVIGRNNTQFDYAFYVDNAVFADSTFVPGPTDPNVEHTVVTEFYAQDVPGYGAGSGLTMWELDDLSPSLGPDVLGCARGPAMSPKLLSGDRVAFGLAGAFLLSVEVVDTAVGPCI